MKKFVHLSLSMGKRTLLAGLLLAALLGLAACGLAVETPPEATSTPSAAPAEAAAQTPDSTPEPATEEPDQNQEALLVPPTLAPTATPGFIYEVVDLIVGSQSANVPTFLGLTLADWVNLVISLLLVYLALVLVARVIASGLRVLTRKTTSVYDDLFLKAILPYLRWLFVLAALSIATTRLQFVQPVTKQILDQVYWITIVALIVLIFWKLVDILTIWYREKVTTAGEQEKEAVLALVERGLRALIAIVGLIIVLQSLGLNVSALLTALGITGLALSLAAQDTIANMISGVIILVDRPFRVGDRIEIQELNTWGDVVDIGLRSTRIRTLDNRLVIVPNSSISNNQIVNYTYPDPRYRIQSEIGVAYGADLRRVREVITQALREVEGVLPDKPIDVLFWEFGDIAMTLRVRWWIESYTDARRIMDRVNETLFKTLEQAQIEMPVPMMMVELKQDPTSKGEQEHAR